MRITKKEAVQLILMMSVLVVTMSVARYMDKVHHSGNAPQVETFRGE